MKRYLPYAMPFAVSLVLVLQLVSFSQRLFNTSNQTQLVTVSVNKILAKWKIDEAGRGYPEKVMATRTRLFMDTLDKVIEKMAKNDGYIVLVSEAVISRNTQVLDVTPDVERAVYAALTPSTTEQGDDSDD